MTTPASREVRGALRQLTILTTETRTVVPVEIDHALIVFNTDSDGSTLTLPSAEAILEYLIEKDTLQHAMNSVLDFYVRVPISSAGSLTVALGAGVTASDDDPLEVAPV